jgi:hypothetical protein
MLFRPRTFGMLSCTPGRRKLGMLDFPFGLCKFSLLAKEEPVGPVAVMELEVAYRASK